VEPCTSDEHLEWGNILLARLCRPQGAELEGYLEEGGFLGLNRVRRMSPLEAVVELRQAGLRGRGPGAEPTYLKWWRFCRGGGQGVLVVDARQGDPRAQAAEALLTRDPYGLIEGLAIAACVTGVQVALLRLETELAHLLPDLNRALVAARGRGLLEGLELRLEPYPDRGLLRRRPPAARELSHSLETWYQVTLVFSLGAAWYAARGQNGQSGTRLLTVGGAVKEPGLVEVPMGAHLWQALEEAGGLSDVHTFQALCLDGGVGGFLPLEQAAVPLSPEEMMAAGVSPASTTVWALDHRSCLVDLTRRALMRVINHGLEDDSESRSLCLHANRLVTRIALRRGGPEDLEALRGLARRLEERQAVGAWALASSLRYFPQQWQAHLAGGSCPAFDCLEPLVAPCQSACPAGIDIPSFVALIGRGQWREAVAVIRQDNPLPYICGLVCPAPCESACLRGQMDQPIFIRALKAVAARHALAEGGYPRPRLAEPSGKRVAVIGAGPAGLTCAYFLACRGHQVTVFEAMDSPGGTTFAGIPAYRLPREVIRAEVEQIAELGVEFRYGSALGRDFTLEELRAQGYDAVFLGIGATCGYRLGLPGEEDHPQVLDAVAFLRRVAQGDTRPPAEEVVVVGGGNAAMDAARTCVRLGCRRVTIAYRRTEAEMPAHKSEIAEAREEGVEFVFLAVPKELAGPPGALEGLVCLRAELGPPDASGRRRPQPIEGSEFTIPAGAVIAAIGQQPDLECLGELAQDPRVCTRRIAADPATGQTGVEWLFAGGDAVTGPRTVVEAVGAGKRAAQAMDAWLRGRPAELGLEYNQPRAVIEPLPSTPRQRATLARAHMPLRPAAERKHDFQPVELGLSDQAAQDEAVRCLRCDLCLGCGICQTACAEMGSEALVFEEAPGGRLVLADLVHAAEHCLGCGACANACPTGAAQLRERDGHRQVVMTGTVLKEVDLVPCSVCGKPFAPPDLLEVLARRLEDKDRPHQRLDERICPTCARQRQARERAARRFLQMTIGARPHPTKPITPPSPPRS